MHRLSDAATWPRLALAIAVAREEDPYLIEKLFDGRETPASVSDPEEADAALFLNSDTAVTPDEIGGSAPARTSSGGDSCILHKVANACVRNHASTSISL